MSNWREKIADRFIPGLKPIFAVADPDDLTRDPAMLRILENKGFEILFYEDPIQFRLSYEQVFRARYDAGDRVSLVIVFSPGKHDFEVLPMDVLEKAERVQLHLKEIFPKLSYNVVNALPLSVMDDVFSAHEQHATQVLDEASSKDFVLRHLYGVDASLVSSDSDLLRFLCRLHYRQMGLPDVLSGHLIAKLSARFTQWPLAQLLNNRAAFLGFLQERWPVFIRHTDGGRTLQEEPSKGLRYRGPALLPFGHDDVRIFIDNFFEDGLLQPIEWSWNNAIAERWIRMGLRGGGTENNQLRLATLVEELGSAVPSPSSQPTDWIPFALRWSQARRLFLESGTNDAGMRAAYHGLREKVDKAFHAWMWETYPRIHNYPTSSPVMVHHIPGFLSRGLRPEGNQKVALLVLDGLALDQWQAVRDELAIAIPGLEIQDSALFAWAPTVTPISRQAIFSGKPPLYFASSLFDTSKDESHWRQFWIEKGFPLLRSHTWESPVSQTMPKELWIA